MPESITIDNDRFNAVVEMVGRTGASSFQIRFQDDEQPCVWMAVAIYDDDRFDVGAGIDPYHAVCRLLDQLVDGGVCTHCQRPTGFSPDPDHLPMGDYVCWYQYDPSTKKIVRGCSE